MWQQLLWQLAPEACASCAAWLARDQLLCPDCLSVGTVETLERSIGGIPAWACSPYDGPIAVALRRFKFEDRPELARRLATTLHGHLPWNELDGRVHFVPVPLHPLKLAARGYNQAALLGAYLARHARARCSPTGLRRIVETAQQSSLGRRERRANLVDAFVASPRLRGQHVVLVDDIVTTGTTAIACTRALTAAGAQVMAIVSVAHTGSDEPNTVETGTREETAQQSRSAD